MASSFVYFLKKYAKIVEPATPTNRGGVVPFQLWPHIIEGINYFDGVRYSFDKPVQPDDKRHLVVIKTRQIGWSWIIAVYALWMAIARPNSNVLLFSKGEKECWELLGKVRKIWAALPDDFPSLKVKLKSDGKEELGFVNGSTIKAFAATESAGVGEAASLVIFDEMEYHPFPDRSFQNVKPTIDSSGGQMIIVFTVDILKPETFAKSIFRQAYFDGTGEFKALAHPYTCRPGRDEAWYQKTMESTPVRELNGLSPELYMRQNYWRTVEEALSPVQSIAAFDLEILDEMKKDCRPTLDLREKYPELNHVVCNIFKDYQAGKTYVATTDSAAGVGKDYYVTVIMDVRTSEVVADFMSNKIPIADATYQSIQLLNVYHRPKWFPEDNNQGVDTIRVAMTLGYNNFGYYDKQKKKIGFHSNDTTRTEIWGRLMSAVNNRQIVIYNKQGLQQFYDIYWNTDHQPSRLEAMTGRHDDYCTAVAIALWACEKIPLTTQTFKPISTLSFGENNMEDMWWLKDKQQYEPINTLSFSR